MYNRYISQPDGSFRRNRMPDKTTTPANFTKQPETNIEPKPNISTNTAKSNINGFLKQLLPKEFDTGDLIIILLLLLMAGDNQEERSNALLTIALYFIM